MEFHKNIIQRCFSKVAQKGKMKSHHVPVILLGMSATGLGALRLLGSVGVRCYGVDKHGRTPAYWSRYCRQGICLPSGATDEDIMKVLYDISFRVSLPPVLMPTSDQFVSFVSRYRVQLGSHYRVLLPDHELIEALLDKHKFAQCAEIGGGIAPKSALLYGFGELSHVAQDLGLPIIVKPACKEHRDASGVPKVILIRRHEEIAAAMDRFTACNRVPFLAQEYIPGDDLHQISVAVCIDQHAKVFATFTSRKIRQGNLGAGVGTYVEIFQDAEAEQIATTLLQNMKYVGVAEVEFKRHAKTGQLYLIEVNPRLWTQVTLPGACGLNFPFMFYCLAAGLPLPSIQMKRRTMTWQSLWDDFYNTFRHGGYFSAGKISRLQWIMQSIQASVSPYFRLSDPMPALMQLRDVAEQIFSQSE